MLQKNSAENIARWTEIVRNCNMECRAQGISKKEWLESHQIQEKHFYYWQTMLRQMDQDMALSEEAPVFTKIAELSSVKANTSLPTAKAPACL